MLDTTADTEVQTLLDTFGGALERGDIAAAVACFQDDCYWRDLVTFTWNIHTSEGKDQIAAMLGRQLATTKPHVGPCVAAASLNGQLGVTYPTR